MKHIVILLLVLSAPIMAAKSGKTVNGKAINIDGHYQDTEKVEVDEELKSLRSELKNVRNLKKNYQKKEKVYGKLVQESEGLKENFESYLEQRDEWNDAIGGYNQLLECTKNKAAKECLKRKSKKKVAPGVAPSNKDVRAQGKTQPVQKESLREQWENEIRDMEMDNVSQRSSAPARSTYDQFIRNLDQKVASKAIDLNHCYKRSRTKQEGILPVMLKVGPGGRLDHLTFMDTTQIYNRYLVNCITRVLYNIDYPKTPNNNLVSIKKVFTFELHHI